MGTSSRFGPGAAALAGLFLLLGACRETSPPKTLTIFHAGSLSVPFRDLSALFRQQHPEVKVRAEAAGSRDTARKVSDLGGRCDVLGSADYMVVQNLLMPADADFNIRFATNEMVIAYTHRSRFADRVSAENWHELLLRDEIHFGRADPNRDPCGYRTVMLFQLAELHYGVEGLARRLERKDGRRFIRPKETDLLALLEGGEIDYLFIYRSVAAQHRLEIVELPEPINLRSPKHATGYERARVQVTGEKPGQLLTRTGAPIVYSVTIPKRAQNRELAEAYLALLLSPRGQAVIKRNGQTPLVPALTQELERVPARLRPLCEKTE